MGRLKKRVQIRRHQSVFSYSVGVCEAKKKGKVPLAALSEMRAKGEKIQGNRFVGRPCGSSKPKRAEKRIRGERISGKMVVAGTQGIRIVLQGEEDMLSGWC